MPAPVAANVSSRLVVTEKGDAEPQFAAINCSNAGDNVIVAGTAGKRMIILAFERGVGGDTELSWESGDGTVHSGPMKFLAGSGDAPPVCPVGHFKTVAGEDLVLNSLNAVAVGGHVVYVLE